ncbi:syntaxin [Plasmodium cynomolgi strain B]|uniref:Syntaxin n=1 Tax=Plasmodium cynomolgi (strain B) TaxID=1120755 RepID=K6UXB7_PLACD|nr:syntaxin [Plasmodium cynomolgi strain B]GAB68394.1 syntaxin [Plasmodium cynomolgi strain B]
MEDILNEIISLSEEKRGRKFGSQGGGDHEDDRQTNLSGEKRHGGKAPQSTWDSSTVCSVDDEAMSAEKASLFSRIINERRRKSGGRSRNNNEEETHFGDIHQDIEQGINESSNRTTHQATHRSVDEHTPLCQQTNNFNSYLLTVNQINTHISCIYKNIDKINAWKQKIDFNIYDTEELNAKINSTISNTEDIISEVKISLFNLNEENKQFEISPNLLLSEVKLRTNIFIDVVQKYKACVNKYKSVCCHYYEHVNANLLKQYRLICPSVTDGEDRRGRRRSSGMPQGKVCKGGRASGGAAGGAASSGGADLDDIEQFFNLQKKNSYSNLGDHIHPNDADRVNIQKMKKRYKELKTLERNISALNELYIELAYVVKKRTNYINSIENNVYQVKDYTDDALHNIVAAKRYHALVKKKLFYFSVFLLVVALVILFPVFFNYSVY